MLLDDDVVGGGDEKFSSQGATQHGVEAEAKQRV
jgi:hypothetical protein